MKETREGWLLIGWLKAPMNLPLYLFRYKVTIASSLQLTQLIDSLSWRQLLLFSSSLKSLFCLLLSRAILCPIFAPTPNRLRWSSLELPDRSDLALSLHNHQITSGYQGTFLKVLPYLCTIGHLLPNSSNTFYLLFSSTRNPKGKQRQQKTSKFRWGEMDEDDDLDFLLPPKQAIGPDENGLKTVIEYKFNDEGSKVKITTTSRVRKLASARLNKRAIERRSWPKFGDAANEDAGGRLTMVSTEEILMERPRAPCKVLFFAHDLDHKRHFDLIGLVTFDLNLRTESDSLTCHKKGDHWTSKCPYKDLAAPADVFTDKPPTGETFTVSAAPGTGKAAYVPPSMRAGADRSAGGSDKRRRNDENSVRVINLSEDTREPDLMELFHPFGAVTRVYVAIDQKTGVSRGFGFVNFVSREDAQRAINKLNGYGYDNLILRVEWATPRPT
ncbi:hypothetical protein F2Q70_00037499 [Brassica cretica]|uniref:Eukaryotic translation initiation factor 3 subunit G n=1 Tax=Brassica cretica TaxID=69181 RepID=A0A8S9JZZ5_BRACR|nr:hypothetical protein F2Q70_00037499 [Brassica cretica]